MVIKILGGGCPNCKRLEENTKKALKELKFEADIIKVKDTKDILRYNIMRTPALVINEKVYSSGRVLEKNELINILKPLILLEIMNSIQHKDN